MFPKGSHDWILVVEGILFALFLLPFLQAKLSGLMGGRKSSSANM